MSTQIEISVVRHPESGEHGIQCKFGGDDLVLRVTEASSFIEGLQKAIMYIEAIASTKV